MSVLDRPGHHDDQWAEQWPGNQFITATNGGGLTIEAAGQGSKSDQGAGLLLNVGGQKLFTGSLAAPTVTLGTYTLFDVSAMYGLPPKYKENVVLTIAADPTP